MIILASQSPRRAELLTQVGIAYRVAPADIDEQMLSGEGAADFVERIAIAKARAVHKNHPDQVVLGADTVVVLDHRVFAKPRDRSEGIEMLLTLAGRTHEVLSGVAIVAEHTHYALNISRVQLRAIDAAEAAAYWDTGEPCDKAGGYAVQGLAAAFIERIEGSYSGIMGLPLFETVQLLERADVHLRWSV